MADFGQPIEEFWPCSPRTFVEILDRKSARRETVAIHADLRAGVLASLLFNANRGKTQSPLAAEDFFPSLVEPLAEARARAQDEAPDMGALLAHIRTISGLNDADT